MANIEYKPVWSEDGQTLSNVLVKDKLETYNVVTEWYDGTPLDDSKLDSDLVYVKYDGKYLLRNFEYGQVLQKDTMQEMRDLSSYELLLLKMGVYKHVQLNGYYEKGDTPTPINYTLSDTNEDDDGGSVIEVGDVKLEYEFNDLVDVRYYGVVMNDLTEDYTDIINLILIKHNVYFPTGVIMVDASKGISIPSNRTVETDGTVFRAIPSELNKYKVIHLEEVENVNINELYIEGERDYHLGSGGEWGMGLNLISCKNIKIGKVTSNMCWGDGVYMGSNNLVPNEGIYIKEIYADRNRRQGLSLISGKDIYIDFIKATNTNGTLPEYGVDIEPNNPEEVLQNINIGHILGYGNTGTFTTAFVHLNDTTPPVSINIGRITSYGELSFNGGGRSESPVKGLITINSVRSYGSTRKAIMIRRYLNRPDLHIKDVYVENADLRALPGLEGTPIIVYFVTSDYKEEGDVFPNIRIEDVIIKGPEDSIYNGVRVSNDVTGMSENLIENVFLKNIKVEGNLRSKVVFCSNTEYIDEIGDSVRYYAGNFTPNFNSNMSRVYSNATAQIENTATVWAPRLLTYSPITFRADHPTRRLTIEMEDNGNIVDYGSKIKSTKAGDSITIKCIDISNNTWIVESVNGEWLDISEE